ncbi:MAG: L-lactate dehydrogenase [Bacilli bacterium]
MNKIVIIGCGNVGMSYAYALLNQRTNVSDLVLIDLNVDKVIGEVMDLNHCLAFAPSKINIKAGKYNDCKDASIVCIAAGANQGPFETRMDLIKKNSEIFKIIVKEVMNSGFNGIFLVATNPLDIMTYITWKESKLPTSKVIGSGTSLDTSRLRYIVGDKLQISPKNVHAYVIGEHGDSEFVPWSNANIGLQNIKDFLTEKELNDIYINVRDAAYQIISKKGATCYGIGMCLVRITNAILGNENSIITVSTYDKINNLFIGLPAIINKDGIKETVHINLNTDETSKLENSINVIKEAINKLGE